jgi:hypothetical protein|nr:MAG TPA: Baseplate component [Caudoviricetes sp.]
MKSSTSISLDVSRSTSPPIVFAKQGDSSSRYVNITITDNGKPYTLDSGITARIRAVKADKKAVFNNATIENNVIVAELTEQILAVEGYVIAEISLYKENSLLTTQYFYIAVQRSAVSDDEITSTNEYKALAEALNEVSKAVDIASAAANKANSAADNADTARESLTGAVNTVIATANAATERANKAAEIVGDVIDGIALKNNDTGATFIVKLRITDGKPYAVCETL